MQLLIDADICLYRACAAVEREIEFEEDMWVLYTQENDAIEAFYDSVATLNGLANTHNYLLAFSDAKNFRKELYPEYKGNRTQRKPMGFKAIRERVFEEFSTQIVTMPTLEADDVIGILATKNKGNVLIWSDDKDLRQIPGVHVTPFGQVVIYPDDADRWFYTQALTGDTTDNYKGCPGIGPKRAEQIIASVNHADNFEPGSLQPTSYWQAVVNTYVKAGLTEEDALLQARLARILRCEDWDEDKQEVKLWVANTTA